MATLSENKIKMIDMFLDGKSVAEIARNLNKSRQCIYNWLKSNDVIEEIENHNKNNLIVNDYSFFISTTSDISQSKVIHILSIILNDIDSFLPSFARVPLLIPTNFYIKFLSLI